MQTRALEQADELAGETIHDVTRINVKSPTPSKSLRNTYHGAILFNFPTYLLPALYVTLSKLWVAQIDSSAVVTTDVWTYMSIFTEVINEGLSRVAYNVIGDRTKGYVQRLELCGTLIGFQMIAGLGLSLIFVGVAESFTEVFVPVEVRKTSITYVRIASFSSFFSVIQYAIETTTRSLDRPDVPLLINTAKVILNIILDLIFLSTFRIGGITPTVNTQGTIRLICDGIAAFAGLAYFTITSYRNRSPNAPKPRWTRPRMLSALRELINPAKFTFFESAFRNGLYLWQTSTIVALGSDYATAWGVFNTIRWGILMVPASALEQAAAAFVGHGWGVWRRERRIRHEEIGTDEIESQAHTKPVDDSTSESKRISRKDIITPAIKSSLYICIIEILLALLLSFWLIHPFAYYLSTSTPVADLTTKMFRSLDWCYVLFTISMPITSILLATRLDIWFLNSLVVNVVWVLPWCIVLSSIGIPVEKAWDYYAVIFGGSLVLNAVVVAGFVWVWWWAVKRDWRIPYLSGLYRDE